MKTTDIENLNRQSKGFQILSAIIGAVFAWAGINITWTLAEEYGDVTFYSLMLAAPLFTVGLLGFLCFWFARMTSGTNAALLAILKELSSDTASSQGDGPSEPHFAEAHNSPSGQADAQPSGSQEVGRSVDGTWTCYAHNKAWCLPCRDF